MLSPSRGRVIGTLAVAVLFFASAAWADDAPPVIKVPKAAVPPKIDGVLDDAAWKDAPVTSVMFLYGKAGQQKEKPSMLTRFSWDDQYLYIGYETFDENLLARGTGEQEGPKNNRREGAKIHDPAEKVDVVEYFVSFGDEHFFWELHHNAANQFNDIFCAVLDDQPISKTTLARFGIHFGTGEAVGDDPDGVATFAMAAKPKPKADGSPSTINQPGDQDTGYVAELRLPWIGLGATTAAESWIIEKPTTEGGAARRYHGPWKLAGTELKILSVMQNGDSQIAYNHSSPTFAGGWFHKGAAHWPRYQLVEAAPAGKP